MLASSSIPLQAASWLLISPSTEGGVGSRWKWSAQLRWKQKKKKKKKKKKEEEEQEQEQEPTMMARVLTSQKDSPAHSGQLQQHD